ncbi:hypothetical protein HEP85_39170 [Streptomyces sp. RPA4-2]|uniref:hypothetical protein n=1 Tax=Streptomyces sp. RPA4-2 TaxID=2721244 RepID=UPI00143E5C4A|nr:hypothetical protein [Streptomyces sp. RPA4-2]QIY66438.1 hypothetical protein HEP85_39170 [Streptomyces sp. RPA4-2]
MPDFWVSGQGDKYHGWEGCRALEGGQASADSQEGYERHNVTRYDNEDAARTAAKKHARCEAHACFARGRGAGLARLSEQALKDLDHPNWLAGHDLPGED